MYIFLYNHRPDTSKINVLIQQWKEGQLTNWEYITYLNLISGRTYQDLMQYPVFPWILADYKSDLLDLTNPNSFRDLEKPIAIQHKEMENQYILNYSVSGVILIEFYMSI